MGALRERNFRMDAQIKSGHDEDKERKNEGLPEQQFADLV